MTLPDSLTNWKVLLTLVVGIVCVVNGIRIWIRKVTKVADPLLWGPLTGGLGCLIAGFIFSDEEIRGIPARMVALFQVSFGLLCLTLFFFLGIWPAYFVKTAKPTEADEPAQEMAYIPEQESGGPGPGSPAPVPEAPPVVATQPVPAANPITPQAPPPAPEKPGSIERMSKKWIPEGMQRR